MSNYFKLNPYGEILSGIESFTERNFESLKDLMLRPYAPGNKPTGDERIREMNLSKAVFRDGIMIGMVNVHLINQKFEQSNLRKGKLPRYNLENLKTEDLGSDIYPTEYADESEIIDMSISFRQFTNAIQGLASVVFTQRFRFNLNDGADTFKNGLRTRDTTSCLWDDPTVVLATKEFWNYISDDLDTWAPGVNEITTQTIFQP